jgi:hypothetical protein
LGAIETAMRAALAVHGKREFDSAVIAMLSV